MKKLLRLQGLLIVTVLFVFTAKAQQQARKLSWNDQFILDKSGKPFPVQDSFISLNGKTYSFAGAVRPAFVYISSPTCLSCKFEFPLYLEACDTFRDIDFVYFTTEDDTTAALAKFGPQAQKENLYIIYRPYSFFYDNQLFLGFPTKYYVDSRKKVVTVQLGGYTVREKVLGEWLPVLNHLD